MNAIINRTTVLDFLILNAFSKKLRISTKDELKKLLYSVTYRRREKGRYY